MKATIVLVVIFSAAILLAGCGHYGMGRHYNEDRHNQTISDPQNMNGNGIRSQGTYGR